MSRDRDRQIRNYISQLVLLEEADENWLSQEDLKEVVLELGYDESDLERLEQTAAAHRTRGENYKKIGELDAAANEYAMALAMEPQDLQSQISYAETLFERFKQRQDPEDRALAERLARQCAEQDPNFSPAYQLLQEMAEHERLSVLAPAPAQLVQQPGSPAKRKTIFATTLSVTAGLAFLSAFGGLLWWEAGERERRLEQSRKWDEHSAQKREQARQRKEGATLEQRTGVSDLKERVPVEVKLPKGVMLEVDVAQSAIDPFAGRDRYVAQIALTNTEQTDELTELDAALTTLDERGQKIDTLSFPFRLIARKSDLSLRPGDTFVERYHETPEDADRVPTRATFEVTHFKRKEPASAQEKVALHWSAESEMEKYLELFSRGFKLPKNGAASRTDAEFALRLGAKAPDIIGGIKLRVEFLDGDGDILDTESFYPLRANGSNFQPGTVRPFSQRLEVPEGAKSYHVVVVELK